MSTNKKKYQISDQQGYSIKGFIVEADNDRELVRIMHDENNQGHQRSL